ncbi:MAG: hypothetical protein ABSG46_00590 [Candidatus Binataceae bacterium]|jgi:hypothetical protein
MNQCLSEKELLTLHAGEGSGDSRAHLEICLSCARNFRKLDSDLSDLLAVLKRPAPFPSQRPAVRVSEWTRGLRWSLAASAIVAAFMCGRLTGLPMPASTVAVLSTTPRTNPGEVGQMVIAANGGAIVPASYGLYIDDLMGSDATDQEQQAADDQDGDNFIDADSGAF